jgi:hypothetical protein
MEVPSVKTPVTAFDLTQAFAAMGLNHKTVELLVAHSALETGWWSSCYNYNLGNQKGVGPSGDWCYRTCGEELLASQVDETDPRVTIVKRYTKNAKPYVSAVFSGNHPQCKFAALDSLKL